MIETIRFGITHRLVDTDMGYFRLECDTEKKTSLIPIGLGKLANKLRCPKCGGLFERSEINGVDHDV